MKKMLKLLFLIMFLFSYKMIVNAKELVLSYSPFYYERSEEGGIYNSWKFPKYDIDGETAYCIQFEVEQGVTYEEADFSVMGIDESKKDRLLLIAYYGYDYPNHNNDYYRAATQALLWELTAHNKTVVNFTTERYGKGELVDVSGKKEEILSLVNHHYDKPDFKEKYTININEKLELNSSLLKDYDLISNNGLKVEKNDNSLIIEANDIGSYSLKLRKKQVYNHTYHFLASNGYQNMVSAGNVFDVDMDINIEVLGAKIKINKKDFDTNENILNRNIKFKVQNIDTKEEICVNSNCVFETDNQGIVFIDKYLNYGNYLISEVCDSIKKYLCNQEGLVISINENTNNKGIVEVDFYNKRNLGSIIIHKENAEKDALNDVLFELVAEEDIIFDSQIVYKKGEIITRLKTDKEGNAKIEKLPLGIYLLYEVKPKEGYELDSMKYEIDLREKNSFSSPIYEKTFINKRKYGIVIIHKQSEFNKSLSDVEYILEASEDIIFNEKVIYKKGEVVKKLITDSEGSAKVVDLPLGKYLLYEVKTKDGYLLDETKYEVDLSFKDFYTNPSYEKTFINYEEGKGNIDVLDIEEVPPMVEINVPDTMSLNYLYYLFNLFAYFRSRRR